MSGSVRRNGLIMNHYKYSVAYCKHVKSNRPGWLGKFDDLVCSKFENGEFDAIDNSLAKEHLSNDVLPEKDRVARQNGWTNKLCLNLWNMTPANGGFENVIHQGATTI